MFAHQGGWDEILLVVGPLAVIGFLLWLANRRVAAQVAAAEAGENPATSTGEPGSTDDGAAADPPPRDSNHRP